MGHSLRPLVLPAALTIGLIWLESRNFRLRSWRQTHAASSPARARRVTFTRSSPKQRGRTNHAISFRKRRWSRAISPCCATNSRRTAGPTAVRASIWPPSMAISKWRHLAPLPRGQDCRGLLRPENPEHCVLERLDRSKLRAGCLAVVFLVALIFGGVFAATASSRDFAPACRAR